MAATGVQPTAERTQVRQSGYPAGGVFFDLIATLFSAWFIIGLFVDGHAHSHGQVDNSFFTPWHALLYSGVLAVGVLMTFTQMRNVSRGYAWMKALPKGYLLSLVGVVLFFIGGGFDFLWHSLFGFEANNEALLSPAHLWLAGAGLFFLTGPLRAAWMRKQRSNGWAEMLPLVLSLALLLSAFTFFTMYAHPTTQPDAFTGFRSSSGNFSWDVMAIAAVLVPSTLISWIVLFAIRRWILPFGSLTLIFTINAGLQFYLRSGYISEYGLIIVGAAAAGLIGDVLLRVLKPSAERPLLLRAFAFSLPIIYFLIYFAILLTTSRVWWSIHMWMGVTIIGGFTGLLLSYLLVPPALPIEAE